MTTQTTTDLPAMLPVLLAMPRADKLRLIETLAGDLARQDAEAVFDKDAQYEFSSPHDSFDAVAKLMQLLEQHKKSGTVA